MTAFEQLAAAALKTGAIQINTENPFTWTSGYRMPIYNDNRLFLGNPDHRLLIANAFHSLLVEIKLTPDVVAGTATAGIPHATTLADLIKAPLIYVRPAAKTHGMKNRIEGVLKSEREVIVIEDLVSTGGSVLSAVEAIRGLGARVEHCFCIFNYEFREAEDRFGKSACQLHSLLTFRTLIDHGAKTGKFTASQTSLLRSWIENPLEWGERRGFPRENQ